MAEGKITFAVGVEASDAISGLKKIQDEMDEMASASSKAGADTVDAFKDIDKASKKSSSSTSKSATAAQKTMKKTAKVQKTAVNDQIKGLDSLKGGAGEVSSSFGQFGGAINVLSPELGGLASQVGALAGGLEGATKMTKLTGGSMKALAIGGGTLGVAVGVLAGAWTIANRRTQRAKELAKETAVEMRKTAQQTKDYAFAVAGLQNSIGLMGDAEFAVLDAKKKSADMTKEQTAKAEMQSKVVLMLKGDIEKLHIAQMELQKFATTGKWESIPTAPFRDLDETIRLTTEAMEEGAPVLDSFGRSTKTLEWSVASSGGALKTVNKEIEKAERLLGVYEGKVDKTAKETERLNLMFQIQAAQARDDTKAVRNLALNLAVLDDTEVRLSVAALRAAEAMAIQQAQMAGLGPATAATVLAIQRLFDKLEDKAAPAGFATTLNQLNTTLDETGTASSKAAEATKELVDVQAEIDAQIKEQAEAYAAAQGLVALQVGDRQKIVDAHRDEKEQLQGLLQEELITFEQYAAKMVEVDKKKSDALLTNAILLAQSKIATAGKFNAQIEDLVDASMDKRAAAIDKDEAAALAAAEGNAEKQEAIRAKFDAKRKGELGALFKAQQATQIASAIMSGASAGVGALAPPPVGLGPNPAGIAMAALVAATTIAQVGVIASQQPAFHQGGIIGGQGDQAITAQGGEVMLNKGAVAAMGGPAAADSLNRGGSGSGSIVVQMVYKQRVLDQLVVDNLAKGGPLKSALNNATRAGRRGRVGGLL